MNGIHDMGGMEGMGPLLVEKNEPVFHAPWEGRVYALNSAIYAWRRPGSIWFRYVIELIPAAEYLRMSYYERKLTGAIGNLVSRDLATREEIESGKPAPGSPKLVPPLTAVQVPAWNAIGVRWSRDVPVTPLFKVGERVRARNINPSTHTRLPRYARGRAGTIERDRGVFVFPDTAAQGLGPKPQHLYSVRFAARELWGAQAKPLDTVYIDMWDDYLEPV
jgi:nitrile hydratase